MKLKYIIYLLLLILIGGAIAYRFGTNKAQQAASEVADQADRHRL
jgi:hypothetical protein